MSQALPFDASLGAAEMSVLRRRAILSCAIGNFVELFDFVIFGLFAAQIGRAFFPAVNPAVSLLSSFATYGVGFVMRPVGAVVIGAYGDRVGRKAALVLTVGLMAVATGLTGLVPSYAAIGIWAPLLLVLCRLVQGFSTGGEWGGAAAFLVEYAQPGKRGITGSMQQFSVGLGLIFGTLTAALLNGLLSPSAMDGWGWRLPFILGFLLAPIGYYLRSRVAETPAFERAAKAHTVARAPLGETLRLHRWAVTAAFGLSIVGCVGNYVFNIFMPSLAAGTLGLSAGAAYTSTAAAAVVLTALTPVMGAWSDRIGRKPVMMISAVGYLIAAYPLFLLVTSERTTVSLVIAQCISAVLLAMYAGPLPAILSELFPTRVRFTALSVGYSLAVTIFGGFAPFIAGFLIRQTGSPVSPAIYIAGSALLSIVALAVMRDPTNAPLE